MGEILNAILAANAHSVKFILVRSLTNIERFELEIFCTRYNYEARQVNQFLWLRKSQI